MKKVTVAFAPILGPAMLFAQQATASARTSTTTSADIPSGYSVESRTDIEASFNAARKRSLPEQPMRDRMAEGRAKAASETQVALAVRRTEARLEATQSAMIRAGRSEPSQQEVAQGEQAMARGATEAQIEAVVRHTPSDRSLLVALDVLTRLQSQGVNTDQAVARIVARLDARASDRAIADLATTTNAHANGAVVAPRTGASVAGSVAGTVNGGTKAAGATAGVAGGIAGVVKPPMC